MSKTFETCRPLLYQSEVVNTNKINSMLCGYKQPKSIKNPIIKKHLSICDIYPFNKKSIIVSLYSYQDLKNINVLQKKNGSVTPTNIAISTNTPFFYDYIIDNNNKLVGKNCNSVNYTNYFKKL